MDERIKKLWVQTLKTGILPDGRPYKKAQEKLKDPSANRMCCLGVLCELHRLENGGRWDHSTYYPKTGRRALGLPSSTVVKWAGLKNHNPNVEGYRLSDWNDGPDAPRGLDHPMIGVLIEHSDL